MLYPRTMPGSIADASRSVLIVIDMQPSFLKAIYEADRVVRRVEFLLRIANLVGVPVLATEQYPERMAGTHERLLAQLKSPPIGKMTFSCVGCEAFDGALAGFVNRQSTMATSNSPIRTPNSTQAVLIGIETHICITQTALGLLDRGYEVKVCEDAVSARRREMSDIGCRRLRHAGVDVAHSESIAYEWLKRADCPMFRDALVVVKNFSA